MSVLLMAMKMLVELLWSTPVWAVVFVASKATIKRSSTTRFALLVGLGVLFGIAYAVALAFFAGPMISAVIIPFFPFMATVGACAGFLMSLQHRQVRAVGTPLLIVFALVAVFWLAYGVLARQMAMENAVSVVVVKCVPTPGLTLWDSGDQSTTLNETERARVQESLDAGSGNILKPMFSLEEGQNPRLKVILIMTHDVRRPMQFPLPVSGTEVLRQNEDDTWQQNPRGVNTGRVHLSLSPTDSKFTRIELEGQFGTQSSEIGVSHE